MEEKSVHIPIPREIEELAQVLQSSGYQAFVVGGAVRDALLQRSVKDWDLCTSALPEEIIRSFPKVIPTGLKHGTVTVLTKTKIPVEVTTFRLEQGYRDGRHPDTVIFTDNLEKDLARRDFTVNAMAFNPATKELHDPFSGLDDLQARRIQTVGNAVVRFQEDGLRPVRAVRFAAQLNFTCTEDVLRAIPETLEVTKKVAVERLREEFVKVLSCKKPSIAFKLMQETGLMALLVPELLEGVGIDQNTYHAYDVFEHSLHACDELEGEPLLRLAALLHDIAKPRTRKFLRGANRFYGHDRLGAKMATAIMNRMRFSHAERDYVVNLVEHHMFYYQNNWSDGTVRRFIRRVGEENIEDLITLRIADEKASGVNAPDYGRVDALRGRIAKLKEENMALNVKALAINGRDVMETLHLKPGPEVGKILNTLLERVLEDASLNERDTLLALIQAKPDE